MNTSAVRLEIHQMPAELLQICNALIDLLQVLMNQPVSKIGPLGAAGIERAEKRPDFRSPISRLRQ